MFRWRVSVAVFGGIAGTFFCALFLCPRPVFAATDINQQVSFAGKIVNTNSTNATDGTYNVEFKVYSGGTSGGGGTLVWTEDRLVSASTGIVTASGTFQVNLGSVCAFSGGPCETYTNTGVNWTSDTLYLSMQVGNSASCTVTTNFQANCGGDGEMTPYMRLTSVPYAFTATQLIANSGGNASTLQFAAATANNSITIPNSSGTLLISGGNALGAGLSIGTKDANTLSFLTNGTTVATFTTTGNLGLGTSSTAAALFSVGGTTGNFQVSSSGAVTAAGITNSGTYNGNTLSSSALAFSAASAASISSASGQPLNIDSGGTGNVVLGVTNAPTVLIGSASTVNTTQHLLQLNSVSTFNEAASCTTSTNQGAVYFNTTTNAIRGCISGSWEDIVTTAGLGIMLFGVVPDSGTVPGDLESTSNGNVSGPCKVSWASATSVNVQACSLYSGGRKIVQAAVTITLPAMATSTFTHLCFYSGGAGGGPLTNATSWFTTPSATETANLPAFSANNPILCIATIKNSASTANTIGQVFDIRIFTTSVKQFTNTSIALAPGWLAITTVADTTKVTDTATAATKGVAGVIAVGSTAAWSSGGPNAIMVTDGPVEVEALAGATSAYNYIQTGTTAGYATTVTTASTTLTLPSLYLGVALTAFGSCATPSAASCQGSLFTQIKWGD